MEINPVLSKIWRPKGSGSTEQDYSVMYAVARAIQAIKIVEIGTNRGFSAITFCQAVLDNKQIPKIWTIDNWSTSPEAKTAAQNFIKQAGFESYIEMIEGNSKDVLPGLFEQIGKVDLVFIDGCHEIKAVQSDIRNVEPYTDCLLLHDTGAGKITYLKEIESKWAAISFPTRYVEGDGHLVGITLAVRRGT